MTSTITCKGVGASFGDRELFSNLDLEITPGDVIGLVGPNGAGKSTLLRILAGQRPPHAGRVKVAAASARIGYLAQEPERREGESVGALLARRTGSLMPVINATGIVIHTNLGRAPLAEEVVVYSGRNEQLIKPLFDAYTRDTGDVVDAVTGQGQVVGNVLRVNAEPVLDV